MEKVLEKLKIIRKIGVPYGENFPLLGKRREKLKKRQEKRGNK